jgi:hypothetical protein
LLLDRLDRLDVLHDLVALDDLDVLDDLVALDGLDVLDDLVALDDLDVLDDLVALDGIDALDGLRKLVGERRRLCEQNVEERVLGELRLRLVTTWRVMRTIVDRYGDFDRCHDCDVVHGCRERYVVNARGERDDVEGWGERNLLGRCVERDGLEGHRLEG